MNISDILNKINETQGTNAKLDILRLHSKNETLKNVLKFAFDSFINFNIVKVPKVQNRMPLDDSEQWKLFFDNSMKCSRREVTGNAAIALMVKTFQQCSQETEVWMRAILEKHLNFGISTKSINKIFPKLIKVFDVQLAEKLTDDVYEKLPNELVIEPKLDGIRCLAVVKNGIVDLYARSGKPISNFHETIENDLVTLQNGVYDGEIMDKDFTALMRQIHRKTSADVKDSYFSIFDFIELEEWENTKGTRKYTERRRSLEKIMIDKKFKYLRLVEQMKIPKNLGIIDSVHKEFVVQGYEGAMIKNPNATYNFGRSDAVIKVKSFFDEDLVVIGFKEGTGRHAGSLGSILVDFNGVNVNVGSGFDDEQRKEIFNNRSKYLGMIACVKYQEITADGSLRFPTFEHWRLDKA